MDREVVTELIQGDLNKKRLKEELIKILDKDERIIAFNAYYDLEKKLGGKGASENAAKLIYHSI